jgi:endonuclease YncB( thermonuclease family)
VGLEAHLQQPSAVLASGPRGTDRAPEPPGPGGGSSPIYPAELVRVLDGDTFEARVHVWPGLDVTTRVRLRGIDAPERRGRCPHEQAQAEQAREALEALLAAGGIAVSEVGLDKYGGRVLASVSTRATFDVSAALLAAGQARAYGGRRREGGCGPAGRR